MAQRIKSEGVGYRPGLMGKNREGRRGWSVRLGSGWRTEVTQGPKVEVL